MAYAKHNFKAGDILKAQHLNEMENGIAALDTAVAALQEQEVEHDGLIDDLVELTNGHTDEIDSLSSRVTAMESFNNAQRYGVSGVGKSTAVLTRKYDAVGMTAQVGTDGDNTNVVNDFDNVAPFNRRKCVGTWHKNAAGKAEFRVRAYYGDADFAEDGSMGDYVAVDCPPAYYSFNVDEGELVISGVQHEGFRPFECLVDPGTGVARAHTYLPCYALAVNEAGKAVSLPGYANLQGDYKTLFDKCKTYNGDAGTQAILMPAAVNFYEWAMFTVEFANQNCQSIMQGCASLRSDDKDTATLRDDGTFLLNNWQAARVVGEYISIQDAAKSGTDVSMVPSHKIVSITRCDDTGAASASGSYTLIEVEDLGIGRTYVVGTAYRIAGRPYYTGACNGVSTPSGSPVNNTSGYYPMKYRWRENVYGNQYTTTCDVMNARISEGDDVYSLDWYIHTAPETLTPANYSSVAALESAGWTKLDVRTDAANYVNGYVKSKKYSAEHRDIWIPYETNGSASTYFCDYASLVSPHAVRSLRLGGLWSPGASAGFSSALAYSAPSSGLASYGGGLYFAQ